MGHKILIGIKLYIPVSTLEQERNSIVRGLGGESDYLIKKSKYHGQEKPDMKQKHKHLHEHLYLLLSTFLLL